MPKLSDAGTTRKISIYQIIITGNVRADYTDIEELAASIKKNTLLEPILVKMAEPVDGDPRYELIAGHRRLAAHQWLCDHGDDFSMIEAKIITGDKLTIQLVENLQRSDLSPRDREKAIFQMSEVPGVTQRDIAAELSKKEDYVSKQIAAYKVRQIAEKNGYKTDEMETSVFNVIQTAAEKDIPMLIGYIEIEGGTVAAAKKIMKEYRPPKLPPDAKPDIPRTDAPEEPPVEAERTPPESKPETKKENVKTPGNRGSDIRAENPEAWKRVPVKHKQVDLNDVFDEIYSYLTNIEEIIGDDWDNAAAKDVATRDAALDIIALIQKRFGD